ncbi:hypothetical protein D9M70_590150 [compost metagenome]
MLRRPRLSRLPSALRKLATWRSMRITSAPISASIIAANGAGPIAFISTTFTPVRGPAIVALSLVVACISAAAQSNDYGNLVETADSVARASPESITH